MADVIFWIIRSNLGFPDVIHYLDDLFVVAASKAEAVRSQQAILDLLKKVGVEWAPNKVEGPSQVLTFLGIEIVCQPSAKMVM